MHNTKITFKANPQTFLKGLLIQCGLQMWRQLSEFQEVWTSMIFKGKLNSKMNFWYVKQLLFVILDTSFYTDSLIIVLKNK